MIEPENTISRRVFLRNVAGSAVSLLLFNGCSFISKANIKEPIVEPDTLDNFISTLPKQVGKTTWNGEWTTISGSNADTTIEGYYDSNNRFRHRINLIKVITLDAKNNKLTLEQIKAVFLKEVNHLYSYEFIDTVLSEKLDLNKYPLEEVHVLADGLAALKLTPAQQKLLYLDYSQPIFNYFPQGHSLAGRPYYPDQKIPSRSVLKQDEFVVWDGKTLTLPLLAAIDIMSTRMKVINPHGIKKFGPDLIKLIQAGNF